MGKLSDIQIKAWMTKGEHFAGRSDGGNLYLRFREKKGSFKGDAVPRFVLRYRFAGSQRVVDLGSYGTISLADARKTAKEMMARVCLGHDVAGEKKQRKKDALAKIEADKSIITVGKLADDYFAAQVLGKVAHPNIVRAKIEKDIRPQIGKLPIGDVKPSHIDTMIQAIVGRGTPTVANKTLRLVKKIFDYAIKRDLVLSNPAIAFDQSDAGGKEMPRDRWLTQGELVILFEAMRKAQGWATQNGITVKLLLMLAVRREELIAAPTKEFDLEAGVWHLPGERTKTGASIDIPLPHQAVELLRDLVRMSEGSDWLLPARKMQSRQIPHIDLNTVGASLNKNVRPHMKDVPHFTIHDLRRTARTHIEALGFAPHIGERCLNHKLKGVAGVYNQHDYFGERKAAHQALADLLDQCECGRPKEAIKL